MNAPKSILTALIMQLAVISYAQQNTWEFKITSPEHEYFNDVIQTQDNKIILTYTTMNASPEEDDIASVILLNDKGEVLVENHLRHLTKICISAIFLILQIFCILLVLI